MCLSKYLGDLRFHEARLIKPSEESKAGNVYSLISDKQNFFKAKNVVDSSTFIAFSSAPVLVLFSHSSPNINLSEQMPIYAPR
jgi:hypothetical protein